jgi:two-component system, NarL family, sensor histidine kinase DegS
MNVTQHHPRLEARRTLKRLLESTDHEQQLIGYEIHDGLAQQLSAALMQFEVFDRLRQKDPDQAVQAHDLGVQLVREGHAEARRLIGGLRPPQLEEGGIQPAIESLVDEANKRGKPTIEFCCIIGQVRLEPMLEHAVFRIVQECIANACRHSKSQKVRVDLVRHGKRLHIEVQEWGIGFEVKRVREGHYGLEGIQERAMACGGRVVIKSAPRQGTEIIVELPVRLAKKTGCRSCQPK